MRLIQPHRGGHTNPTGPTNRQGTMRAPDSGQDQPQAERDRAKLEVTGADYERILHVAENLREQDRQETNAGRWENGAWEDVVEDCLAQSAFGCVAKNDDEPIAD